MQTAHDHGTKLEALPQGQPFRFYYRNEEAIGLKAQFEHGSRDAAALVLTPTKAGGLEPGALLSSFDVGDVVELSGAKIVPSTKHGTMTPGAGHIAEPGEIELLGSRLIFVTKPQGNGLISRVDIQSGAIGRASDQVPVEIYSEWAVVRDGETLHEHKPPTLNDPAESITVIVP
jgi:hypothetical protein